MATKVQIYNSTTLIGEGTSSPNYPFVWNPPIGDYDLTAKLIVDGVEKDVTPMSLVVNDTIESGLDADYLRTINVALANNISLPTPQQRALDNQWIIDYKATNAWEKRDAIFKFKSTAPPNFRKICLKRGVIAKEYGNGTWSNLGWRGNAVDAFIDPLYDTTNSSLWLLNDASIAWSKENSTATPSKHAIAGAFSGNQNDFTFVLPNNGASSYAAINNESGSIVVSPYGIQGYNVLNRISATQIKQNQNILNANSGVRFEGNITIGARIFNKTKIEDRHGSDIIGYFSIGGNVDTEYNQLKSLIEQ